jgi:succinate-semialdehyde dehydrogenase/glutarate-semialdehyde dehydrogenase
VPEGVVGVVPTTAPAEVVSTWLTDDRVRKVSFTGSTGVGKVLLKQAADRVLNSSMELGGNAPFVVAADADIDAVVAGAMIAKFRNAGQACTAANRFFVHEDVVDEFVARFGEAVENLQVAPLISAKAVAGVTALVDEAVDAGARVVHLGSTDAAGWFYPVTLLVDVRPEMRIAREEIFGPVVSVITWRDEPTMLAQANDTEFGLAAYVYAGRLQDALRIAEALDAGMVGVNRGIVSDPSTPFGGVKQSGIGREGAREGMREYQETQYFSVDWS